jgi:hypothetical protein
VTGEGLGNGVAGESTDGGDGGVAEHVGRHRGSLGPVEAGAGPSVDRVVAPGGDRRAPASLKE